MILLISAFWGARITGITHLHQAEAILCFLKLITLTWKVILNKLNILKVNSLKWTFKINIIRILKRQKLYELKSLFYTYTKDINKLLFLILLITFSFTFSVPRFYIMYMYIYALNLKIRE
jgi:hypothetical protein